jgi:ABC-2 type transport system ATP-binding protein
MAVPLLGKRQRGAYLCDHAAMRQFARFGLRFDPMQLPEYAIEARGLVKTYAATRTTPAKTALKGVDLQIPRGSIFGLLGPNGAGKSTFINILAGLVRKSAGTVKIWDRDIDERPRDARACIGVVAQEIAADVFFTPRESLEVQAGLYGVPKRERRTLEILKAVGLGEQAEAYVRQLSGGMKRRLMVAKAMVHNPPVLILDEPTAGVDVELRRQLWAYVVGLNKKGVTVVLTTHYLEEAQELCDQIAIINHGEVVACEPTSQLLRRLDTRTVVIAPTEPLTVVPSLGRFEGRLRPSGELAVTFKSAEAGVEAVLAAVKAAGVEIRDLATEDPDLEDVFMALTYDAPSKDVA